MLRNSFLSVFSILNEKAALSNRAAFERLFLTKPINACSFVAVTGWSLFWLLFLLAVVGLVLTQGRGQGNWFFRIVVGVISLYGIVGAYGASGFLGDVISYARLMALSLTSAALGSTFNMLAQLAGQMPVIGGIIAILMIICGHLMNYFLGILGAFVHSARLVMLEFFGRFYEAGGYAYRPYGFDSATVEEKPE